MRRQHRPRAPLPRLELVQCVGVEHELLLARSQQLVPEHLRGCIAAETGPDRERAGLRSGVAGIGPGQLHRLEQLGLDDRKRLFRDGDRDIAGIGAEGSLGGEAGGARHSRGAAGDEHRPGAVLAVLRPLARDEREDRRRHEPVLGLRGLEPDVRDHDLTGVEETGRDCEPELAAVEGDGQRRPNRGAADLSRGRVDTRGDVDGDDRRTGCVDPLDRRGRLLTRLAVESRPEERVDDHVGLLDCGRLDRVAAFLAQDPSGDPAVAAVRAAAADDGDPARIGEPMHHLARYRRTRALHQLRDLVALLRGPRLLGRVQRLKHR